jgi:hypothetical protein
VNYGISFDLSEAKKTIQRPSFFHKLTGLPMEIAIGRELQNLEEEQPRQILFGSAWYIQDENQRDLEIEVVSLGS